MRDDNGSALTMARADDIRSWVSVEPTALTCTAADTPRYLVTLSWGIGNTVLFGLSAIDQLVRCAPNASRQIDVLCTPQQAEVFSRDPRINRIIGVDDSAVASYELRTWMRAVALGPRILYLSRMLRERKYEAVLPSALPPQLFVLLHTRILHPWPVLLARYYSAWRHGVDRHITGLIRCIVADYFGHQVCNSELDAEIPMYLDAEIVATARRFIGGLRQASATPGFVRVLLVAPDSSSVVTRPPTELLVRGIGEAMRRHRDLICCVLPSYSAVNAACDLEFMLATQFQGRIFSVPSDPRPTLLELAALIDQADLLVTGDTGVMHLAVTRKLLADAPSRGYAPRNSTKIIAVFGGTNPSIFGYSNRTLILGRGRKEQRRIIPGLWKELHVLRGHKYFDHVGSQQLAEAILNQLLV